MAIIHTQSPADGIQVLSAKLDEMFSDEETMTMMLQEDHLGSLALAEPHQVYLAGMEDITDARLLAGSERTTWRYLVIHNETVVAEAELMHDAERGESQFLGLHRGGDVDATVSALHSAEALPQINAEDFELRLLRVPSLAASLLWLHGKTDLLIPLSEALPGLDPNRPYSEQEVLDALRELVTELPADAPFDHPDDDNIDWDDDRVFDSSAGDEE